MTSSEYSISTGRQIVVLQEVPPEILHDTLNLITVDLGSHKLECCLKSSQYLVYRMIVLKRSSYCLHNLKVFFDIAFAFKLKETQRRNFINNCEHNKLFINSVIFMRFWLCSLLLMLRLKIFGFSLNLQNAHHNCKFFFEKIWKINLSCR